jgi:hypothetical protein
MTTDRTPTVALAVAVILTAVAFGPAVSAVDLPRDSRAEEPVFKGFVETNDLGISERFSYALDETPRTATAADGTVSAGPAAVTVAAGADPVALRYRLQVGDRSTNRTVVVPAGETRTVAESPAVETPATDVSGTTRATLRVTAAVDGRTYTVHNDTLGVTADA